MTGGCARGRTWTAVAMVIAAVLATAGCSGQGLSVPPDDAWVRTQDDVTQVSVELPGTAEKQEQAIPTPDGGTFPANMWMVNLGEDAASVAFMAAQVPGPIDLNGALEGMANNVGGTIADRSEVSQGGHDAIDGVIEVTQNGTEGSVYARVIDGGDTMVILQSVGRRSEAETLAQLQDRLVSSVSMP